MSIRDDAQKNLELAGLFDKDSDYNGEIAHAVMRLVNWDVIKWELLK